jgi:hypothetical protein
LNLTFKFKLNSMQEEELKCKKEQITLLTKELKSHYFEEFFVDPDKKFTNLLDKIIVSDLT